MTDAVIHTEGLRKTFGGVEAVRGLDVEIRPGEMFGLVGPDGAGKTTTIRMLCGILAPTAGSARVLGHDLAREAERIKPHIGYLSQRFSLYGDLTVDENLEFFAEIHRVRGYRARRDELLAFTRLEPFRRRLADRLSGGMKQKLALACTLIHTPRILFLDEPTTGVDPVSRRDFWRILSELLRGGITILMSTPYLDEAERCTRVGLLNEGRLIATDAPAAIRRLMPGEMIEIVCTPLRAGYRLLKDAPAALEVQSFGDRLNVRVAGAAGAGAEVRRLLEANGVEIHAWRPVPPSLENVFISLIR